MKNWIWILSLATLALAVALALIVPKHEHIRQPVLALELARNWSQLAIVLAVTPAGRARFLLNTQINFAFIAAYTALFTLLALTVMRGYWRWITAGLAVAAGVAGVMENLNILAVLPLERGFENAMALAIRQWALTKWCLMGLVWLTLGMAQYRRLPAGILYAAAGLLALWGCLEHRWLEVAVMPLGGALLAQLWTYFPSRAATSWRSRSTAPGSSL